jgi:hypothetical protein
MRRGKSWGALLVGLAAAFASLTLALAADPPADGTLLVTDAAGKEQKLKAWKWATGTRRLTWLTAAKEEDAGKDGDRPSAPAGPEALVFRDESSTTFIEGILTLVPLERLRSIEYDDKDTVTAHVATSDKADEDEVLTGTTKYRGINKIALEAEIDKGDLGVAEVKFLGGVPKGIRSVRFPAPKAPAAAPAGRTAQVTIAEKQKNPTQKVIDLQPLYKFADGSERLVPTLMFKKTLKLDINKLQKLRAVEGKEGEGPEWAVTVKGGEEETYTLLTKVMLDGKPAALAGLVGRVAAGYKLFPVHTIAEVELDEK